MTPPSPGLRVPSSSPRLQVKKILSANSEAPLNVECILEDTDLRWVACCGECVLGAVA